MSKRAQHIRGQQQREDEAAKAVVALLNTTLNPALEEFEQQVNAAANPEHMPRVAREAGFTPEIYASDLMAEAAMLISPITFAQGVVMSPQVNAPLSERLKDVRKHLSKIAKGSIFNDPHRDLSTLTSSAERIPALQASIKEVQTACRTALDALPAIAPQNLSAARQ